HPDMRAGRGRLSLGCVRRGGRASGGGRPSMKTKVAIIGSGNIATDLMFKIERLSPTLTVAAMAGIDPASDGLARARRLGKAVTHEGVEGLVALAEFEAVEIVFDATSAGAHRHNDAVL